VATHEGQRRAVAEHHDQAGFYISLVLAPVIANFTA
jgi:hypothetical protein